MVIKDTLLDCSHHLVWRTSGLPVSRSRNDIALVYIIDGSMDPSIVGYVAQMPDDAAKYSPSIKQMMSAEKPFRCAAYY